MLSLWLPINGRGHENDAAGYSKVTKVEWSSEDELQQLTCVFKHDNVFYHVSRPVGEVVTGWLSLWELSGVEFCTLFGVYPAIMDEFRSRSRCERWR
jgi:hypothetical protein